jgi:uncharacterized protein (TIGR03437 family)
MKLSIIIAILGAVFLPGAFGQGAAANNITGMGYLYPSTIVAPGQLISVFLEGNPQGDFSAAVSGLPAPVLEVRPGSGCPSSTLCSSLTAITIQIPYEIEPGCALYPPVCNVVRLAELTVTVNGVAGAPIDLTPAADRVHLLTACDTVVPGSSGFAPSNGLPCAPLVQHADGSLVTSGNPAVGGEEVVAYAVGLGLTTPPVPTGQAAATATPTSEVFILDFNFRPNALATQPMQPLCSCPESGRCPCPTSPIPVYAGLTPGYVGLYQINFVVPAPPVGVQPCSSTVYSNLTVSVGGFASFDGAGICVAPSPDAAISGRRTRVPEVSVRGGI